MEKLFLSILISILLNSEHLQAQTYAVFKSNGVSKNIINQKQISLKKGSIISEGIVKLNEKDTLLLLDNNGKFYELHTKKDYSFKDISKYEKSTASENLSSKYFSYVWKQMNSKEKTKNHTGNVYRDDLFNILIEPRDSISINTNEISFVWEESNTKPDSYFFLKNDTNNTMTIIKVQGNSLSLFTDNNLLVKGNSYSWTVAHEKYPSFNRIKFHQFTFLNENEYAGSLKEYDAVRNDMEKMGYSKSEINDFICQFFNLCSE